MKKIKSELINEIINKNLTESDEEFVPSKFQKYSDQITRESFEISNQKQSDYYKKIWEHTNFWVYQIHWNYPKFKSKKSQAFLQIF